MSHEILLIAGGPTSSAQGQRRRLLEHAALLVPGADTWTIHANSHVSLALVTTVPSSGTVAYAGTDEHGKLIVLGASEDAVKAARDGRQESHLYGAEAGHIKVTLGSNGELDITCDGVGSLPSFWSSSQGEFLFATHLASMVSLGVRPIPDEAGMVEYLVTLHPLNNRTVLRDVTLLPGGGRITWAPNSRPRLSVNRLYLPSDDRMSDDAAIAEFETVWSTVMVDMAGRIDTKRAGLGLSGGLDSRAIAAGCVDHGFRPATFTYGNVHTNEGRVSSHVAEVLGLDHTIIPVRQDCLLKDTSRAVSVLDGAHSPAEMYELWFCDVLRNFADVVINGLDGDVFWGNDKALGVVGSDGILHAQLRRYGPELTRLREFLAPDFGNWATDQFTRSLGESMTEWDLSSRADMVVFWRVYNRQLRWGNALTTALRRSGLRTELPFRDSRFLRFSARLTPAQRRNGQLYLETHRRLFSQISGIARSSDGNAPDHLDHVYWSGESSYTRQLARLAMRHPVSAARRAARQLEKVAVNRSPDWLPLVPWKNRSVSRSSIFPADLWLRTSRIYRERLLELLESSPTLSIFSSLAIDQFADSIRSGQANSGALLLAKIATLQAWFADYSRREASRQSLT